MFVTLWCTSLHNRNYEQLIAAFFMLSIRAINTICATIAITLKKSAKFSFTIGDNFSKFLNWIFSIALGTEFNKFSVFSAVIVVICTGVIL